ncbi:nitrite reductase small subunit NirD [Tolumonas lignilytica]|jgi:nitrite reductase [NAD(P)H], small subunit|uniref:nitrite reductase small subunit NirD n=1 Tax=Tolumonas lignilytica TaxID=1283284 RepID=UPI0004630317|nr:nitrite reductase small subunit NirD [Tolumonas lignilytica]
MSWTDICALSDIIPGTGVCALLGSQQVAIFRPLDNDQVYAIDNIDPFYQASVLSRGILADLHNEWYVASPLKKQHFNLKDGTCLENTEFSVAAYAARVTNGRIELKEER